jgi:hypothetical protein
MLTRPEITGARITRRTYMSSATSNSVPSLKHRLARNSRASGVQYRLGSANGGGDALPRVAVDLASRLTCPSNDRPIRLRGGALALVASAQGRGPRRRKSPALRRHGVIRTWYPTDELMQLGFLIGLCDRLRSTRQQEFAGSMQSTRRSARLLPPVTAAPPRFQSEALP